MSDYSIEEYKTLREEILLRIRLQSQAVLFSGSVFMLALTFLSRMKGDFDVEYWGLALLLIITPFYLMYRMHAFAIAKIASYIEKCIEPLHAGLNWTAGHIDSPLTDNHEKFTLLQKFNVARNIISMYFFIMVLVSWLVPFKPDSGSVPIWVLAAMVCLTLIIVGNYIALLGYKNYRKRWELIWIETMNSNNASSYITPRN